LVTSGLSLSFSPISELLAGTYGVSILEVNTCAMVFTVTEIPGSMLVMYLFSILPPGIVLKIGTAIFFVGGWLRQPLIAEA